MDIKKYNMGSYFAIGLSFLNIILFFMPFTFSRVVPSEISAYGMFLNMFDPVHAEGVGALLLNAGYNEATGSVYSAFAYIIPILAVIFLCFSVMIIAYCFVDLYGLRANKKLVTYLSYGLVVLLVIISILLIIRSGQVAGGVGIGYGLVMAFVTSSMLAVMRYLKIQ